MLRTSVLAGLIVLTAPSAPAYAQAPVPADVPPLLEVPYLAQPPDLCGGAALAMVLRYWGDHDVVAQDFSSLIDRQTAGIPTSVLAGAAQSRGWKTLVTNASPADSVATLRTAVDRGHPVIALIEHAPLRYHYVVVVGLTDGAVVFHDPAVAPYRVVAREAFERAWAVTERWMLVVERPAVAISTAPTSRPTVSADAGACADLVTQSVAMAQAGDTSAAERGLLAASRLCPLDAAAWRELAGLRFLASQWDEAGRLATIAVRLAPTDEHAWQLLATSEYLQGNLREALRAWNHVGAPRGDTVTVVGATRTRWPVITDAMGLTPREMLTPDTFTRASRRLAALPAAADTHLRFEPTTDGRASLEAVVVERPMLPTGLVPLAVIGARAIVLDDVRVAVAGPTGSGELWSGTWNWSDARPHLSLELEMPSPVRVHRGLLRVGVLWERESYPAARVDRRAVAVHLSDWAPRELHWEAGVTFDRLNHAPFVSIDTALDKRARDDRVALRAAAGWWTPAGAGKRFQTGALAVAWRSTAASDEAAWSGVIGAAGASVHAPSIAWPGAGTGQIRVPLLRAHPLADAGVIVGAAFGRTLVHGSTEFEQPFVRNPAGRLSGAVFVDAARAWHRLQPAASRLLIDIGAGLRLRARGMDGGVRIDLAYGVRDGRRAVSLGWARRWPQ